MQFEKPPLLIHTFSNQIQYLSNQNINIKQQGFLTNKLNTYRSTTMLFIIPMWTLILLFSPITFYFEVAYASQSILPLLQYDLTMHNCHNTEATFVNEGILDKDSFELIRNANTTSCTFGMGIESNYYESYHANSNRTSTSKSLYASKSIGSLLESLGKNDGHTSANSGNGFTLSLWIRPHQIHGYKNTNNHDDDVATSSRAVLTIGSNTFHRKSSPTTGLTLCEKSEIDFQLSIVAKDMLEIVYRTNDQYFEPCQRIIANVSSMWDAATDDDDDTSLISSKPTQISISLTNYHQRIFVNGKTIARRNEQFDPDLKHWNPSSILQFFTYPSSDGYHQSPPWDGQLFRFSLYRDIWDKGQVTSIMSEGLPPAQPLGYPKVATICEDAWDENNETLQQIEMPYSFLDIEIENLLTSLELPNQPAANVRHYITRFPLRGSLFYVVDGRKIEPDRNIPVLVNDMDRLVYLPRKDEHSEFRGLTYTTFDYCVTTNKIVTSSQCVSATISVVVDPVNDPPVATIPPTYSVHEGVHEEAQALLLTGSDIDRGDFIQSIQITSPPKSGCLFLSVSSFRKEDRLLHGTLLSTVNNTISGKEAYVEYRFTDYDKIVIQDSSVADFFRFRVQDSVGSWSKELEVNIQVLSSVSSSSIDANDHWIAPMIKTEGISHQITGRDSSGLNRTVGFFVKSLPAKGVMLDEDGAPLVENQIIESHGKLMDSDIGVEAVNLTYVGIPSLCEQGDSLLMNDTLTYQVVALGTDNDVMSVSSTKEEQITVVCAVEPLSIQVSDLELEMIVSEFVSRVDDKCGGYMFDFTEESKTTCSDVALIFGFQVKNTEKLREPVYVSITSHEGLLSLNKDYISEISPLFDQQIMRTSIRFLSPSDKLGDILSTIHFQSNTVGIDEIRVVLQYGRCYHEESFLLDHEFSESATECYKVERVVTVTVQQNPEGYQKSHYPFPWVSLLIILILGPILYTKGKARQAVEDICVDWKEEHACDPTIDIPLDID